MDSKQNIINCSKILIYQNGYNNTSVSDILNAAEAGKGQFYYYFDSKKSLGLAVIEEHITKWREELFNNILSPSDNPKKDIKDMLQWICSNHANQTKHYGCPIGNLVNELAMEDEDFRFVLNNFMTEWINLLAAKIEQIYINKKDDNKPSMIAASIISQIQGSLLLLKVTQDNAIFQETINSIENIYCQ